MTNIERLIQHLKAYKILPEPHYQAIGEHLLTIAGKVDMDIDGMKETYEAALQDNAVFLSKVDEIARKDGSTTVIESGDYFYTVGVSKVHKSLVNNQS